MQEPPSFLSRITSLDGINYLNIGLMFLSVLLAFYLPFELFVFVYAVLGPLHYLTEISWLEKKNYFVPNKKDTWLLLLLVLGITLAIFNEHSKLNAFVCSFLFSGFVYALVVLYVEKPALKYGLAIAAFLVSVIFNFNLYPGFPYLLFVIWLPTIIHVFVFTGVFILFGALKSKSKSGYLSFAIFLLCALSFFLIEPDHFGKIAGSYAREAYQNFRLLNVTLYEAVGFGKLDQDAESLFSSAQAVVVMRFIAFAYTYHYLNWFSKTTVIRWNNVSRFRLSVILVLWILSVGLYAFSYEIGFYALFLLSILHVFLEFPLNHLSIVGTWKELTSWRKR